MPTPSPAPTAGNASLLRRFAGFLVDWVLSSLVTFLLLPYDLVLEPGQQPPLLLGVPESSWAVVGVFFVLNVVLVSLTGSTVGHRLMSLQVWQVRPGVFPLQVVVRSALAALVLPALFTAGGRGLHDVAAGTRIVRPGGEPPAA
ncbi:RDD family protein [Phycicoccus avicenniae]|uniref:RDD family protein n=1 Tax=Phycicoccus avicenniae TaxID=2828860 RepID=UPI003D2D50C9